MEMTGKGKNNELDEASFREIGTQQISCKAMLAVMFYINYMIGFNMKMNPTLQRGQILSLILVNILYVVLVVYFVYHIK
jgi:hypothetical protein